MIKEHFKHWLPDLLNASAVTIGSHIFYSCSKGSVPAWMYNHEMAHVAQYKELGIPRFLAMYVLEYIWNRFKGLNADDAYKQISFEIEAQQAERSSHESRY